MTVAKLTVCNTFGDPIDPRSWSGTSRNICDALNAKGRLGALVDGLNFASPQIMKGFMTASWLRYAGSYQHERGWVIRRRRAAKVRRTLPLDAPVLHLGVGHLPLSAPPSGLRQFAYLDSTFNSWATYSTRRGDWKARLYQDSDEGERQAFHQMEHLFTIGEYLRDDLVSHYGLDPSKITAVGTGRGMIRPYFGDKDYARPMILFVAKARWEDKGGPLVVEGFHKARQQVPGLRLVLVGQEQYQKLARGIEGVEAFGFASLEKLQSLFEEAALFAMPAVNEPWGLVYLEAMACRAPIVALRRNAIPEMTDNGHLGFCLARGTADEFAQTVIEALSDVSKLRQMGIEAQQSCLSKYRWDLVVDRMLEVIDGSRSQPAGEPRTSLLVTEGHE
jgi:glycosyltransferase involved in cell wall biosynthesis